MYVKFFRVRKNLQRHSLRFHDMMLFLNLFNELQFFILFGTASHIFGPKICIYILYFLRAFVYIFYLFIARNGEVSPSFLVGGIFLGGCAVSANFLIDSPKGLRRWSISSGFPRWRMG